MICKVVDDFLVVDQRLRHDGQHQTEMRDVRAHTACITCKALMFFNPTGFNVPVESTVSSATTCVPSLSCSTPDRKQFAYQNPSDAREFLVKEEQPHEQRTS